ncbi:unnamed protein product [Larinioides sclopetarius]|uniref:Uncharacterized protein n=1 Tax=Larinioides sclopetarius TaxID=280406 RepID=A0AAV2A624_9ARAC
MTDAHLVLFCSVLESFRQDGVPVKELMQNGIDYLLVCARALAQLFAEPQSLLNVARDNTSIFTLILVVKNAIVCYGISTIVPVSVTVQLLLTLTCYTLVLFAGNCVLNFALIWASFGTVLCFTSGVVPFPPITRFVLAVTTLCLVPTYFTVPCTLECVIDIFLIVHLSWYFLKAFLGPFEAIVECFFLETTVIMILLAFDLVFRANGYFFMALVINILFPPFIRDAFDNGKLVYFVVMSIIYGYCMYEQVLLHHNRSANVIRT